MRAAIDIEPFDCLSTKQRPTNHWHMFPMNAFSTQQSLCHLRICAALAHFSLHSIHAVNWGYRPSIDLHRVLLAL